MTNVNTQTTCCCCMVQKAAYRFVMPIISSFVSQKIAEVSLVIHFYPIRRHFWGTDVIVSTPFVCCFYRFHWRRLMIANENEYMKHTSCAKQS